MFDDKATLQNLYENQTEIYTSTSYSEFSVRSFFNHMGNLFYCKDHFYFHIYIHISKKRLLFHVSSIIYIHVTSTIGYASPQWPALQLA